MTDLRQSPDYARYLKSTGWVVEKIDGVSVFIRRFPLLPLSIIKIQRPEKLPDHRKIDRLARKYHAAAVYLEPLPEINHKSLIANHFQLSRWPYLPTKTVRLDLNQSEPKILEQMKKDCRYGIRKSYNDISIYRCRKEEELRNFYRSWKKTAGWKIIIPSFKNLLKLKKAFGQRALLLTASESKDLKKLAHSDPLKTGELSQTGDQTSIPGQIIAGTVVLISQKTAYYYHAFTTKPGRRLLAQYGLVWEAIKRTKKIGCRSFDFEGINDSRRPNKAWKGFTHFKKSFGGKEITYPGCFKKRQWLKHSFSRRGN
ncbi:MAG: peptidoglycan bridge formation glycyltransferase FemA/FemB family protein [Candidatus Pacebacteria bacterium]|nr:peptidoglycan bridge formation glycyltransferase FemA/FemB family protein [Candidatus Paceibacterota bacterium]